MSPSFSRPSTASTPQCFGRNLTLLVAFLVLGGFMPSALTASGNPGQVPSLAGPGAPGTPDAPEPPPLAPGAPVLPAIEVIVATAMATQTVTVAIEAIAQPVSLIPLFNSPEYTETAQRLGLQFLTAAIHKAEGFLAVEREHRDVDLSSPGR